MKIEFYNLASDPLQTNNLIADPAYQSRITEMDALYQADQSSSRTSPALDYSDPNVRTQWTEVCGDGIITASESCDDGDANGSSSSCCQADCTFKPAGAASCDGNTCTRADSCLAGVCTPGPCATGKACSFCGGTCADNAGACDCLF